MNANTLRVNIQVSRPVDLQDLTSALAALGNEYSRFAARHGVANRDEHVKLYVHEVRKGSIEMDLVDAATFAVVAAPVVAANINTICDFASNLKNVFAWLTGLSNQQPSEADDARSLRNIKALCEPVAKDPGASMTIAPIVNNSPVQNQTVIFNTTHAAASNNRIEERLRELDKPAEKLHEKVLLRWYQTRNDPTSSTGDKAIVESLWPHPVKTTFMAESVKARMLNIESNIFHRAFLVDIRVETVKGRASWYIIHAIHDSLELDQ